MIPIGSEKSFEDKSTCKRNDSGYLEEMGFDVGDVGFGFEEGFLSYHQGWDHQPELQDEGGIKIGKECSLRRGREQS